MESTRAWLVTDDFSSPFPHLARGGVGEKDKLGALLFALQCKLLTSTLHFTILHTTALSALHFALLHCIELQCFLLHCTALHKNRFTLRVILLHCVSLCVTVCHWCAVLRGMSLPFERVGAIESEIGIITAASYSKDLSARFSLNFLGIFFLAF